MYPIVRLVWQLFKHRKDAPLGITDTHVSRHMCLPWDIDLWMELNNGRTLTIFDLGRIPLGQRVGLLGVLKREKWGLTVAGASIRYRRRIRMFETIEMRSRAVWWDDKFTYIEQSMWKHSGECANHILLRTAVTGASGIVPPTQVMDEIGPQVSCPKAPAWVTAWIAADAERPWPPMQE